MNFASELDEAKYTTDNPVTEVKRTISVFDVWTDFLKGEYKGHGFTFGSSFPYWWMSPLLSF